MDRGSWRAVVHGVVESKMAEQLTHSFSSLMIKGQSLKNLGFSPCSKVSGSGEGSSSPLCYISPGLLLPVPNFPLHSVELLTSLLSSTFLPIFLHFYIIFTPNLSHLLSPSLPPTSSPRPIPTHPTPIKHVPEVRSVWSSGDWLARVSTFHWTQKNLGGFPTFGTLRAQSEWWLGTPLHARRGTELGTKSDSPTPAAPVM